MLLTYNGRALFLSFKDEWRAEDANIRILIEPSNEVKVATI
jgi:hypothetical protein